MMKLKNNRGVTLVILTITVTVLLIVTSITIYNATNHLAIRNLNHLYADLDSIGTKVSDYYLTNHSLPVYYDNAYFDTKEQLKTLFKANGGTGEEINPNDDGPYYVLNLSRLENLTLNFGRTYENWTDNSSYQDNQDLYIINGVTHQIYYPQGITYRDTVYFTMDLGDEIVNKIETASLPDGVTLTINESNKNTISGETKVMVQANITLDFNDNYTTENLQYGWRAAGDTSDITYSKFTLDENNSATLISKLLEDQEEYDLYIKVYDKNGYEHIIEQPITLEIIDNSQSLVLGLVDDLGTRSTIYLYGNSDQITSGEITITMPDNSTKTITATSDNTEISDEANYATYTVTQNGTYTFSATNGTTTTETKIKVSNIETFTPIEQVSTTALSNNAYSYKGAAVPKGYYVDTKSEVDTGLVITDEINNEGYATGNEWVWVPINSTVGNDDYYIEESGNFAGATSVSYSKYSKLYSFSKPRTRDTYGTFYPSGNSSTENLTKPSQTDEYRYREPSLLTSSGYGETTYYSSINIRGTETPHTNVAEVATQYKDDYENMIESVNTYGGFYIGRYEITVNGEKAGDSLTGVNWYVLYNECMKFDDEIVTSGMMYGTLWDATMQWLSSKYDVGYTGNTTSGYGNYYYEEVKVEGDGTTIIVKPSGTRQALQTGQTTYTKSNNIYDISGNHYDFTQEAVTVGSRVLRGGYYGNSSNTGTYAAGRNYVPVSGEFTSNSSRSHLYIKK